MASYLILVGCYILKLSRNIDKLVFCNRCAGKQIFLGLDSDGYHRMELIQFTEEKGQENHRKMGFMYLVCENYSSDLVLNP